MSMQPSPRNIVPADWHIETAVIKRTCTSCRAGIPAGAQHLAVYSQRHLPDNKLHGKRRCRDNYCTACAVLTLHAATVQLGAMLNAVDSIPPFKTVQQRLPRTHRAPNNPDNEPNWMRLRREKREAARTTTVYQSPSPTTHEEVF